MPTWLKWLVGGCLSIVVIGFLGMVGCIAWLGSTSEGGVKLPHEMDDYALENIDEHGLLEPGEELRAYYDATIAMDGTEAAILTDRRVMYHRDGETTVIALDEIADVDHRRESVVGDVIEVVDRDGQALRIEIAMLNDGPAFARALERARAAGSPSPATGGGGLPVEAEPATP
jgi:hypothetical protein